MKNMLLIMALLIGCVSLQGQKLHSHGKPYDQFVVQPADFTLEGHRMFEILSDTMGQLPKAVLLELAEKNKELMDTLVARYPEWFEVVIGRDTIDFKKNKVVLDANGKEVWVIKPSQLKPEAVILNANKFKYRLKWYQRDSIQEYQLLMEPINNRKNK